MGSWPGNGRGKFARNAPRPVGINGGAKNCENCACESFLISSKIGEFDSSRRQYYGKKSKKKRIPLLPSPRSRPTGARESLISCGRIRLFFLSSFLF